LLRRAFFGHNAEMSFKRLAWTVAFYLLMACDAPRAANGPGDLQVAPEPFEAEAPAMSTPLSIPGPAATLSAQLADAPDFASAVQATRDVLAEGGVSVSSVAGVIRAGKAPVAWVTAYEHDVFVYALHGRHPGRATLTSLEELGRMLGDFGWPAGNAPPSKQLGTFLAEWTRAALAAPDDPTSFAPLFIAATAQRQSPPINVLEAAEHPEAVRLSALEVELFFAAFDRMVPQTPAANPVKGPTPACTAMRSYFGALGEVGATGAAALQGKVVGDALQATADKHGWVSNAKSLEALTAVIGIAQKVTKLALLYLNGYVEVDLDPGDPRNVHKALESEPTKQAHFKARVGMASSEYQAYQQSLAGIDAATQATVRDCMQTLGLPTIPSPVDLLAEIDSWRVAWFITQGAGTHGLFAKGSTFDYAGRLENQVTRDSPTEGSTPVVVDLTNELRPAHEGPLRRGDLTVRAELKTGQPPSLGTLANACSGWFAMADAVAELAAGWIQNFFTMKSYVTLNVEEHALEGWVGTLEFYEVGDFSETVPAASSPYGDHTTSRLELIAQGKVLIAGGGDQGPHGGKLTAVGASGCRVIAGRAVQATQCYEGCPTLVPPDKVTTRDLLVAEWGTQAATPHYPFNLVLDLNTPQTYSLDFAPVDCDGKTVQYPHVVTGGLLQTDVSTLKSATVSHTWDKALFEISGPLDDYRQARIQGKRDLKVQRLVGSPFVVSKVIDVNFHLEWDLRRKALAPK
jgi:hypothetical protein